MAKIMLVEDDNNLRQIYQDRLEAEGYSIVAAQDGEEALALAVKERPDLIIADIMMPKVSGFDMLDILRSTPETKDAKIIMMTALSQAEDQPRAKKLGADKYLVKSQVTLEDVVKVAADMLNADKAAADTAVSAMTSSTEMPATPLQETTVQSTPVAVAPDQEPATKPAVPTPIEELPTTSVTEPPTTTQPSADEPVVDHTISASVNTSIAPDTSATTVPKTTNIPVTTDDDMTNDSTSNQPVEPVDPEATTEQPMQKTKSVSPQDGLAAAIEERPFVAEPSQAEKQITPTEPEQPAEPANTDNNEANVAADEKKVEELSVPASTEEKAIEEKVDDVIANNPTLSTSAEIEPDSGLAGDTPPAPEPLTPVSTEGLSEPKPTDNEEEPKAKDRPEESGAPIEKSDPSGESTPKMQAAVDDLVSDAQETTDASETTENVAPSKTSSAYVSSNENNNDDKPTLSMSHERRIEPTDGVVSAAPDLNELLAQEENNSNPAPPPVNSVIQPGGGGSISDTTGSFGKTHSSDTDPNNIAL